jgi:hypothetical protein
MPGLDTPALLVFAQQAGGRVDPAAWTAHAERFFATRVGLAEPPLVRLRGEAVELRFVIAPDGAPPGVRAVVAAPREDADLALADRAEARASGSGLALLARRCPWVWRVSREGEGDALALRLAAVAASLLLGPVVDPRGPEIFGVKTARAKLEALRAG